MVKISITENYVQKPFKPMESNFSEVMTEEDHFLIRFGIGRNFPNCLSTVFDLVPNRVDEERAIIFTEIPITED